MIIQFLHENIRKLVAARKERGGAHYTSTEAISIVDPLVICRGLKTLQ